MCVLELFLSDEPDQLKIFLINFTSEEIQILEESSFGMVKTDLFREWHLKMALILFRFGMSCLIPTKCGAVQTILLKPNGSICLFH